MEQYRDLVRTLQGDDIQIVETLDERETVALLGVGLIYGCASKDGSTTTQLAFYSTADASGVINVTSMATLKSK